MTLQRKYILNGIIMKRNRIFYITMWMLGWQSVALYAQRNSETVKKTLSATKVLLIDNINGAVNVEGSNTSTIEIVAQKLVTGGSKKSVAQGNKETLLNAFTEKDTAVVHIKSPYVRYRRNKYNRRGYGYSWNDWDKEADYDFKFDIDVKVPRNVNLIIRTVNRGDISIKNTQGDLVATNVNGSIYLKDITGNTKARTINGQLKANYIKAPDKNSSYYSLNGNIRVTYPKSLSAEFHFKSFNGDFYTDYEVTYQPASVIRKSISKGKKKVYKVSEFSVVKVRNGGKVFKFETLNGNIYVNHQK